MSWTVTFSESVTGVDTTDFALAPTGGSPAHRSRRVTGTGTTCTVTVNTGSGDGTLGLNLVDDDSIVDGAGNKLGGTGAGNGNLTGEVYTIDKTAPTAPTIASSTPASPATSTSPALGRLVGSGIDGQDLHEQHLHLERRPAPGRRRHSERPA